MNPRGSRLCFPGWTLYNRVWEIDKPKVAFDLGANEGGFTVGMMGLGAWVHAFEPAPYLAGRLREKLGGRECIINQLAVSDKTELLKDCNFYKAWMVAPKSAVVRDMGEPCMGDGMSGTFDMKTIDLDAYIDGWWSNAPIIPDFIKMDVDGYEYRALKGMTRFLATHASKLPPILFEFSYLPTLLGDSIPEMCAWIYAIGYVAVSLDGLFYCETWQEMADHCPEASSYDIILLPKTRLAEFGIKI